MQKLNVKLKNDVKARAFVLSLNIIELCEDLPKKKATRVMTDQLLRSAMSIGANITEAQAATSKLEFKRYYEIALKSARESTYWMGLLKMSKLISASRMEPLIKETIEISRMLGKSVITLKAKK